MRRNRYSPHVQALQRLPPWTKVYSQPSSSANRAPFSLRDKVAQRHRNPTLGESDWLFNEYKALKLFFFWPFIIITTKMSPTHVPLTVAGVAAVFCSPGLEAKPLVGSIQYYAPRMSDPCPELSWPRWSLPSTSQMAAVVDTLSTYANIRRINFLVASLVVKLVFGDGRVYQDGSSTRLGGRIWDVLSP